MDAVISRRTVLAAGAALPAGRLLAAMPSALSVAAMRGDLSLLQHAYERLHPGLYRYATPAQVAARCAAARDATSTPLAFDVFYLRVSRLLATIRCGHSYANFSNQPAGVRAALFEAPARLPLEFLWLGDRMVVTRDPHATGIAPGSAVIAIDGVPAAALLRDLLAVARADGHNDGKRRRLMSVQGGERYESFDVFLPLLLGDKAGWRLSVEAVDGQRRTVDVAGITLAQRRAARPTLARTAEGPAWTIERRGAAAVLTMDDWALYDSPWDWRGWLHAAVDRLVAERAPRLIVDLRRNEGGIDCGDELIARLIDRPVTREAVRRLVRYETLPTDLRPFCDTWDRSFDRLGVGARRIDARFLQLADRGAGGQTIAPRGPRYAGQVLVLIGPQNSSATFQFAGAVQRLKLATLVGEETGGNRRGINGGCFYFLRLPATGLEADLPLIGNFALTPEPDAGVRPDIPAAPTAALIAAGIDPAMARALA